MKILKKTCGIVFLSLILAASASAGDMLGGVINPPPPPSDQAQNTVTADQATEMTESSETALAPHTEGVLSILQSVLALF